MIPLPVTKDLKIDTVMNTIRFIIISLTAAVAAVSCTKNEMEGCGYGVGGLLYGVSGQEESLVRMVGRGR